jgi:hypothetical protein
VICEPSVIGTQAEKIKAKPWLARRDSDPATGAFSCEKAHSFANQSGLAFISPHKYLVRGDFRLGWCDFIERIASAPGSVFPAVPPTDRLTALTRFGSLFLQPRAGVRNAAN